MPCTWPPRSGRGVTRERVTSPAEVRGTRRHRRRSSTPGIEVMGAEDFGGPPLSIAGARPDPAASPNGSRRSPWRKVAWGGAALLLLLPLAAMQVTDEVDWGPGDFALAGTLVVGVGLAF